MSFLVLPPEVNSALMFAGAGSGPTLAAAAAWDGLAAELGQAANSFSSATAALADTAWQGPAATAMAAAAAPYASWLTVVAHHGRDIGGPQLFVGCLGRRDRRGVLAEQV